MFKKSFSKKIILSSVLTAAICGTCFFNTTTTVSAKGIIYPPSGPSNPLDPVIHKNMYVNIISPDTVKVGENVQFDSKLNLAFSKIPYIKSYSWDFGNGSISTSASPSHSFNTPGTYTIRLKADAESGYDGYPPANWRKTNYHGWITKTITVK